MIIVTSVAIDVQCIVLTDQEEDVIACNHLERLQKTRKYRRWREKVMKGKKKRIQMSRMPIWFGPLGRVSSLGWMGGLVTNKLTEL